MKKIMKSFTLLCMMVAIAAGMMPARAHATGEANPRILVETYSISDDEITPGEEFELTMKLRNSSIFYDTYSVVTTISDDTDSIYPVYGTSDQLYVERVYARNSWDITFKLQAAKEIKEAIIPLKVFITYNDNKFFDRQVTETYIYLPVKLSGNFNVYNVSIPENVAIDTKARIALDYENTGTGSLKNIKMNVSGDDTFESYTTNLFSMSGGTKNTAEVFVDCNKIGQIPITIQFSYEDENGKVYQMEPNTYNINVVPQTQSELGDDTVVINGGVSILTFVILAAIIVIAMIILFIIKNRERK